MNFSFRYIWTTWRNPRDFIDFQTETRKVAETYDWTVLKTWYFLQIIAFLICELLLFWYSCSNSPESGLGTSHTSLPGADSDQDQFDGHNADPESEYYEADLLPAIGTCRALYPFDGKFILLISEIILSSYSIFTFLFTRGRSVL